MKLKREPFSSAVSTSLAGAGPKFAITWSWPASAGIGISAPVWRRISDKTSASVALFAQMVSRPFCKFTLRRGAGLLGSGVLIGVYETVLSACAGGGVRAD